jgi:hypothetical protein
MNRARKLQATFSDGGVRYLTTEKAFTHAWRITGVLTTKRSAEISGWARSEALAREAAAHHARSVARRWRNVNVEIVELDA